MDNFENKSLSNDTVFGNCIHSFVIHYVPAIIVGIGLIVNILAITSICLTGKVKIPTYTAILCLAVSDSLALVTRLARVEACAVCSLLYGEELCSGNKSRVTAVQTISSIPSFMTLHGSFCHVILLAAVRYVIIVHPLKARGCLTSGKVIGFSGVAWTFTLIVSSVYGIACMKYLEGLYEGKANWFMDNFEVIDIIMCFYLFLVTLIPLLLFHIAKRKVIPATLTYHVVRMNRMVIVVALITVISLFPLMLRNIISMLGLDKFTQKQKVIFFSAIQFIYFLRHVVNPVLYFWINEVLNKKRNYTKCCQHPARD
ncbi:neuromedin-U receptor 2-like [Saccostrea cucullata]|uniref:neuromedin-U receptor 2-like n=1 Tax=Saccostrea cuccullata TaxID=36930 RepID=UPI002ED1A56E